MALEVEIARLGERGDGLTADSRLVVPGALPGERVRVEPAAEGEKGPARHRLMEVLRPSPDRVEPFCPYFGACGGCAVQHLAPAPYGAWKRAGLAAALERAGIATPVDPLVDAHGAGRRRITLHVREGESGPQAGFMAARRHDLVPIEACPVAVPGLARAPAVARSLAELLGRGRKPLDVQCTATEAGLDVDVRGHGPVTERTRRDLVRRAEALDLARLSIHGELVVANRPAVIGMGRARILPPAGCFLQATQAGEAVLSGWVVEGLAGARQVLDLFCGCGPFALRLAQTSAVHAVDSAAPALAALDRAARETAGLRRVTVETRDLFRRPLLPTELARFDALVLDPPRAGAEAQVRRIAEAGPARVVMVSCDPATFARDLGTLIAAGYAVERIVPIDQFKWSSHLEMVAILRRPAPARRR